MLLFWNILSNEMQYFLYFYFLFQFPVISHKWITLFDLQIWKFFEPVPNKDHQNGYVEPASIN